MEKKKELPKLILSQHVVRTFNGLKGLKRVREEIKKGAEYYLIEAHLGGITNLHMNGYDFLSSPSFGRLSEGKAFKKKLRITPTEDQETLGALIKVNSGDEENKIKVRNTMEDKGIPVDEILKYFDWDPMTNALRNNRMAMKLFKHYRDPDAYEKTTGHLGIGHAVVLDIASKELGKPIPHELIGEKPDDSEVELADKITWALHEKKKITKKEVERLAFRKYFSIDKDFIKKYYQLKEKDNELQKQHKKFMKTVEKTNKIETRLKEVNSKIEHFKQFLKHKNAKRDLIRKELKEHKTEKRNLLKQRKEKKKQLENHFKLLKSTMRDHQI